MLPGSLVCPEVGSQGVAPGVRRPFGALSGVGNFLKNPPLRVDTLTVWVYCYLCQPDPIKEEVMPTITTPISLAVLSTMIAVSDEQVMELFYASKRATWDAESAEAVLADVTGEFYDGATCSPSVLEAMHQLARLRLAAVEAEAALAAEQVRLDHLRRVEMFCQAYD
jgi:hypothetical protein